jgi:2-keto-3-deoxy-L-rhamnonate aldolase RhmA
MNSNFKSRLLRHETLIGSILTLPVPELAEICCQAGLDWLFLDMEHGLFDVTGVERIAQVLGDNCPCLVRVPLNDEVWIKKTLDVGVNGLIIPLVKTAEDAARAVRQSKYPPLGARSVGITRASRFGAGFAQYVETANDQTAMVIQIEHIEAVRNLESILSVPGVDAVLVGPYDLSGSLGKTGQVTDPEVTAAVALVKQACAARGIPAGIFARDVATARQSMAEGYTLVAVGLDTVIFLSAMQQIVGSLR